MSDRLNRRQTLLLGLSGSAVIGAKISGAEAALTAPRPTQSDALGPFFVSGMPEISDLNRFGKPGEPLRVEGWILSAVDDRPVVGAVIEVWQTDGDGNYHPQANGAYADYRDEQLDLRGTVRSDASGRFGFDTVAPGDYFPRPKHFHYRLRADGYQELVTQHYVREGGRMPGGRFRSAEIQRKSSGSLYPAPVIYLQPLG